MKNLLLVGLMLVASFSYSAQCKASGLISAEIEYSPIAPNTYYVEYHVTRDCQSAVFPNTKILEISFGGCRPSKIITLNKVGPPNNTIGDIYCRAIGNSCTAGALPYYELAFYWGVINLIGGEQGCATGILEIEECPGIETANVASAIGNCTTIRSEIPIPVGTAYTPEPFEFKMPVLTVNVPATASFLVGGGYSLDDSIVYSLVPLSYKAPFSATNPLPSSTPVVLDPQTGQLRFTPNVFNNSGQPGANDYAVLVEVKLFSKYPRGGPYRYTGSIKRLKTIRIVDNTPNVYPEIINVIANGNPVPANNIIPFQAGNTLNLQFSTADANVGDSLEIKIANVDYSCWPGYLFMTSTGGVRPSGSLTAYFPIVGPGKIYLPLIVTDNACPFPGVTTRILELQVSANPLGQKDPAASETMFSAYPNPFTTELRFKLNSQTKAESILIYNLLGQQIDQIPLRNLNAGQPQIAWEKSGNYATGTYLARLVSEGKTLQTLRFIKQ